jgi:hypothetical protein
MAKCYVVGIVMIGLVTSMIGCSNRCVDGSLSTSSANSVQNRFVDFQAAHAKLSLADGSMYGAITFDPIPVQPAGTSDGSPPLRHFTLHVYSSTGPSLSESGLHGQSRMDDRSVLEFLKKLDVVFLMGIRESDAINVLTQELSRVGLVEQRFDDVGLVAFVRPSEHQR